MPPALKIMCAKGYHLGLKFQADFTMNWLHVGYNTDLDLPGDYDCDTSEECAQEIRAYESESRGWSSGGVFGAILTPLNQSTTHNAATIWRHLNLCHHCRSEAEKCHQSDRTVFWHSLPVFFGFSDWDKLVKEADAL